MNLIVQSAPFRQNNRVKHWALWSGHVFFVCLTRLALIRINVRLPISAQNFRRRIGKLRSIALIFRFKRSTGQNKQCRCPIIDFLCPLTAQKVLMRAVLLRPKLCGPILCAPGLLRPWTSGAPQSRHFLRTKCPWNCASLVTLTSYA